MLAGSAIKYLHENMDSQQNSMRPQPEDKYSDGSTNLLQLAFTQMMDDASIDEIKTLDTNLRVVTWNHICEAVTGIPREEAVGKEFLEIYPQAKSFPAITEALQQALLGRRSFVPHEKAAYLNRHSEHHVVPLKDENGTVQGIMMIIHDIAHRLAAESRLAGVNRELQQKVRELQRANSELATFTHVTSHDLKEPLRKIYTFVELTITEEHGRLSDKGRSNLRRVQSSVQRMGLLTDDLVTFAEVSAGDEEAEWLDLREILEEAQKPLRKSINETGATVDIGELPKVFLPRRQAVLLMQHLLSNAVKFVAPDATPKVKVEGSTVQRESVPASDAADSDFWCIKFSDNGIGIEPEYHERIFTLFQRLHAKGEYSGTGIGLAMCKKIVERRGGFITVESTPGAGSCFTCWIPATDVPEVSTEVVPAAQSLM